MKSEISAESPIASASGKGFSVVANEIKALGGHRLKVKSMLSEFRLRLPKHIQSLKENPIPAGLPGIGFFMFSKAIQGAYAGPLGGISYMPNFFSNSATAKVVLITVSGLRDMVSIPHSTTNSANSR